MMRPVFLILLMSLPLLITACARQFAVSVNNQTLYDPRPVLSNIQLVDPGMQSCLNLLLQQGAADSGEIRVFSCAGLAITTVDGIANLQGLQFIDISNNQLPHLDELRRLALLGINAENNRLNDISALLNIPTLVTANLRGNPDIPCQQLNRLRNKLGQNLQAPEQCER
ncbi:MAG: hypothetical protein RQ757_05580 [Pseudomonadales bacterium]|nr:hypothetical protein [Pseudomonadales bacterium]